MSLNRAAAALALVAIFALACGDSAAPDGASAHVTGSFALAEYPGLSAARIVAQNADGSYVSSAIAADGSFQVSIPTGGAYRLSIAHMSASGSLVLIAHVRLSQSAFWARYEAGGKVDLGEVRPSPGPAYDAAYDDYGFDDRAERDGGERACGRAELPYDVKLELGDSFRLGDAFAQKGPPPAGIVSVTMEGGSWRLSELRADREFVVSEADCAHDGNRDVGRDRIYVTWQNADGSRETDHLDLRYCESSSGGGSGSSGSGNSGSGGGDKDSAYGEDDAGCTPPPGETPPVCVPPTPPVSTCDGADLTHVTPLPEPPPHFESSCITRIDPPPVEVTGARPELL